MARDTRDDSSEQTAARTQAETLTEARRLAVAGIVEVLAGIHQARQAAQEATERRECSPDEALPRAEIGSAESSGDLLFDLARLQIDILKRVLTFQRQHADTIYGGLQRAFSRAGQSGRGPLVIVKWRLAADGALESSSQRGRFVVENRSTKSAHVSLSVTPITSRDEPARFIRLHSTFHPAEYLLLRPDEEREIALELSAPDSALAPGQRFRGQIHVQVAGRPKLELPLRVEIAHRLRDGVTDD